jgi:hypothetical protein
MSRGEERRIYSGMALGGPHNGKRLVAPSPVVRVVRTTTPIATNTLANDHMPIITKGGCYLFDVITQLWMYRT